MLYHILPNELPILPVSFAYNVEVRQTIAMNKKLRDYCTFCVPKEQRCSFLCRILPCREAIKSVTALPYKLLN